MQELAAPQPRGEHRGGALLAPVHLSQASSEFLGAQTFAPLHGLCMLFIVGALLSSDQ